MDKKIERKNKCYEEIRRVPKQHRSGLYKRLRSGEFDLCGPYGLSHIRMALEYYPEKTDRVLEQDYSQMSGTEVFNKIRRLIPGYTETPAADAFKRSMEGCMTISKASARMIAALDEYSLTGLSRLRLGAAVFDVTFVKQKIDDWLKGTDKSQALPEPAIDVESRVVESRDIRNKRKNKDNV